VILSGTRFSTVLQRGWAGIKNGELLALAEKEFDVFITVDRKISTQQDLKKFQIAVILVRYKSCPPLEQALSARVAAATLREK
jgi:hypothetical protein